LFLVVSSSAIDCLERLISKMKCVEWDVKPYTLIQSLMTLGSLFTQVCFSHQAVQFSTGQRTVMLRD